MARLCSEGTARGRRARMELKFWQSDPVTKYGIRVIPSNVLVDSKGTIVARNLFGEDLDHLLNKLLSK